MTAQLKETEFLKVELPDVDYLTEQKEAIKDIGYILKSSGLDKFVEIGLPDPRK